MRVQEFEMELLIENRPLHLPLENQTKWKKEDCFSQSLVVGS